MAINRARRGKGRVFQASLLNTGQPPKLIALFKLMFQLPVN
jgi:hypothetical protein